ncbi:MAG: pilus assembly protein PilP [Nitrospirae bacterium]|nr:pilus assembly protein PilP [Nitrospirota bacterium]
MIILLTIVGCSEQTVQTPGLQPATQQDMKGKQPPQAVARTSVESAAGEAAAAYSYRTGGRRDPFRSLILGLREKKTVGLTPLQQRSLGELKVIGIIWGSGGYVAMIETPDGKGYLIKEGVLIGSEGGVIKKITEDSVIIEEVYTDYYGRKMSKKTVLGLHAKEEGGG